MASQRCRVLLGDNYAMFRQGLRALLDRLPDLVVVGEVGDSGQAVDRAVLLQPDVVVLAAWLPGQGVHEATAAMRERAPDARVIVLGTDGDPRAMYEAIKSGAMGYVPRTSGIDDLVAAIRQVADGQAALPPAALTGLVGFITSAPIEPSRVSPNGLSEREQDVLELVAQGRTNREIGEVLCVAESTVRSHLHNILSKLNVANRVQAAAFARGHRSRQRATSAA
ncbi:MAG TPA: response regulator transcription factor [Chloroflexota bacterium]|jgi:NarL family two-component system response regulator LiaR